MYKFLLIYFTLILSVISFATCLQGQNCLEKNNPLYNEPFSFEGWDINKKCEKVEYMKFKDGTNPLCVLGMKSCFNNKGIGLLCGYKIAKASGEFDLLYGNKLIYSFVMYKSSDGLQWDTVKNNQIVKTFTDTIGEYLFSVFDSPISLSTDGNYFYLASTKFSTTGSERIQYYRTNDLKNWQLIVEKVEGISDVYGFEFTNNSVHHSMICKHGFHVSLFSKSGNIWKKELNLYSVGWGLQFKVKGSSSSIQIYIGKELYFHNTNGFLFQNKEKPYYLYNSSNQNKDFLVLSNSNEPSEDFRVKNGQYDYWTLPEIIYKSDKNSKIIFAEFFEGIYKSTDGGLTFKKIWLKEGTPHPSLHPICDSGTLFLNDQTLIYKSTDGGNTWEGIAKIRRSAEYIDINFLPDGTFTLSMYTGVWRFKEKCKPTENSNPNITFGTTIITHGYQPLNLNPIYKTNDPTQAGEWVYNMAKTILNKAENKGCICRYDKKTGIYKVIVGDCAQKGEKILMFDWRDESNNRAQGYSEAAGDALFASLIMGYKKGQFDLDSIHFIGHSRGTVVNSLTVERLLILKNYPDYKNIISIDQVTNIDPHDWGYENEVASDLDDAHPDIEIEFPIDYQPNNGTIAWKGVAFNDTYYQDKAEIVDLKGRLVWGTSYHKWDDYDGKNVTHGIIEPAIHTVYTKTILDIPHYKMGGYYFSRLSNGYTSRAAGTGHCNPKFNFYDNLINPSKNINRITGILNGSFDRFDIPTIPQSDQVIAPGWVEHGGGQFFYPGDEAIAEEPFSYIDDGIILKYYWHFKKPMQLVHNRFYIPKDAKSIRFLIKTANVKNGVIIVTPKDCLSDKSLPQTITIPSDISDFKEHSISLAGFQDKVVTLTFEFKSDAIDNNSLPQLILDEVKLSKQAAVQTSNVKLTPPVAVPKPVENKIVKIEQQKTEDKPLNSTITFDSPENWQYTEGTISWKIGTALLKLPKSKTPVKLSQKNFTVSKDAKSIQFSIKTLNVQNGSLIISIKDNVSGKSISKPIKIAYDILKPKVETLNLNAFKGKAITINFEFKSEAINNDYLPELEISDLKINK